MSRIKPKPKEYLTITFLHFIYTSTINYFINMNLILYYFSFIDVTKSKKQSYASSNEILIESTIELHNWEISWKKKPMSRKLETKYSKLGWTKWRIVDAIKATKLKEIVRIWRPSSLLLLCKITVLLYIYWSLKAAGLVQNL